jgi:hypothetical protein
LAGLSKFTFEAGIKSDYLIKIRYVKYIFVRSGMLKLPFIILNRTGGDGGGMPEKPSFAYDYKRENVELVRQTCLYAATKLGDLLDDLVVVGGLVPSLLIPEESLPAGEDVHIGTMDLDLGLSLAILEGKRYEDLTFRLHRAGFEPDENEDGNPTLQRWKVSPSSGLKVTVDFLIPPSLDADKGGDLRHIEKDFAAVITPGLRLAFQDKMKVPLKGLTLLGEKARRCKHNSGKGADNII